MEVGSGKPVGDRVLVDMFVCRVVNVNVNVEVDVSAACGPNDQMSGGLGEVQTSHMAFGKL
jgi:hypothetical protein